MERRIISKNIFAIICTVIVLIVFATCIYVAEGDTSDEQVQINPSKIDGNETFLIGDIHYINGEKHWIGNVTDDYRISARDALLILKHCADIERLAEPYSLLADVDLDEKITAADALVILKYAADCFTGEGINIEVNDCIKVDSGRTFNESSYTVISTIEEYELYMQDMVCYKKGKMETLNTFFDAEYFEENSLLAIKDFERSSSIKVNFSDISYEDGKYLVNFSKYYPIGEFAEVAFYEYFIPISGKNIKSEDVSIVVTEVSKPEVTTEPTPTVAPMFEPEAPVPTWINSENANKYCVEGIPVVVENLNGAIEHTSELSGSVYEFTDINKSNNKGIEISNPIAQNAELVHDYGYLYDVNTEGLINAFHLYGTKLGWGRDEEKLPNTADQFPSNYDPRCIYYPDTKEVYYPTIDTFKGFSMSFWSKADYVYEDIPIIVFADEKQTLSVTLNAEVKYTDSVLKKNKFITNQNTDSPNYASQKWHYYTITFANDWICVYIDGVEVLYDEVVLDRNQIGAFNDGFMTRYNTAVTWTEEEYGNDWRGYISNQRGTHKDYETITSDKYTLWGNSRYRGVNSGGELLLTFMTNIETKVYVGGAEVMVDAESAKYAVKSGSQVKQIEYYLEELDWEQVYANYVLAQEFIE